MGTFNLRVQEIQWAFDSGEDIEGYTDWGMDSYPIFDEGYRGSLNRKILEHYWMREIGHETFSHFRFALRRKLNEIMPYYNQLYKTERLNIDPLSTVDISTVSASERDATTTDRSTATGSTTSTDSGSSTAGSDSTNTTDSRGRSVQSETPQVRLAGDEDYATSAADSTSYTGTVAHSTSHQQDERKNAGESSTQGDSTGTAHEAGTQQNRTTGRSQSAATLINEYRTILLNIDMMVVEECDELFMQLWDNGDEIGTYGGSSNGSFFRMGWPFSV